MLDFHTHILPGIDDGSEDIETSCKMLEMLSYQGVDTVVATPHFYYDTMSLEKFKEYRERSRSLLLKELESKNIKRPAIALGAEVKFFYGLDVYQNTEDLCIEGTRFLLVEMPFERWEYKMYSTLRKLNETRSITPVVAHVERYLPFNSQREMMKNLIETGALVQCNTAFFNSLFTRHKAFRMFRDGLIQFIGTDCHNLSVRRPDYDTTINLIKRKNGGIYIKDLEFWEDVFLKSGAKLY